MDVLSGVSIEGFKILAVIVALLVGVGIYFLYFRKWYWGLVGAASTFVMAMAGAGLYVLLHINDPRWSAGKDPLLEAPRVAETPLIGQYLEPLGAFLNSTASSINDFVAFRHALPIAQDFFTHALWGLAVFALVLVVALVMSRLQPLLLEKKVAGLKSTTEAQKVQIQKLTQAVNEMRAEKGLGPLE